MKKASSRTQGRKAKPAKKSTRSRAAHSKRKSGRSTADSPHTTVRGSSRLAPKGAVRIRNADPHAHIEVTITLRGAALPDGDSIPSRPMTVKELASQFGASREDADKVARVLKRFGLKIEEVSLPTGSMRVSGTVAAMENAFHPHLAIYRSD